MRIDRFLSNLPRFNRQQVRLLLAERRIQVDGLPVADPHHEVREFSRVDSFAASDRAPGEQHVELPVGAVPTLYPAVGAGFGVVTGVGTLVVLGWLLRRAARRPSPPSRRPSTPLAAPLDATRVR